MLPLSAVLRRTLSSRKNVPWPRRISTGQLDPILRDFTSRMVARQPTFSLPPHQIQVLKQPADFHSLLLEMIRRAERRIFLSSLYIGSAERELLDTITDALATKPSLQVFFQLDFNRSTRPGPSSTAKLLLPLLEAYPSRVQVSMFRSPSLRGLMARVVPPRFNEGWGTWHPKVYGVDDEVIISGANLNKSYFTDRQDRYLHFNDQSLFAQYCFDFLQAVAGFSFRLLPLAAPNAVTLHSCVRDDFVLQWPDPEVHPHHIHEKARNALLAFQSSRSMASKIQLETSLDSLEQAKQVLVFPAIQAGQFGIHEEETSLRLLFRHVNTVAKQGTRKRPLFDLTSGYFSLFEPYQKLILESRHVDCRIVAAGPKANGFFGSNGISGRIPEGYTYFEKRFMRAVGKAGRLWREAVTGSFKGVQLSEWNKPGWTYHAKGIWLSPSAKSLPILTLFGSTNLNSRSARLDTELSFVMVIPSRNISPDEGGGDYHDNNKTSPRGKIEEKSGGIGGDGDDPATHLDDDALLRLRKRLKYEIDNIRVHVSVWKGASRRVRFTTKAIVWLVKGML